MPIAAPGHQADQYGLEVFQRPGAQRSGCGRASFPRCSAKWTSRTKSIAGVKFWFYNHPPLDERMRSTDL